MACGPFLSRDAMLMAIWRKLCDLELRVSAWEPPGKDPKGGKK